MENEYLKHLFQAEFSKMVAVISKRFGLNHIELAEDIVSETFFLAAETWGIKGIPENPAAWLYTVAKNKTLYHFRRNKIYEKKIIPELISRQEENHGISESTALWEELDFSIQNIKDSQLQMMFAVCNPAIASEAQIGLALRILCGFGIDEIAEAFLTNKETINKRLFRAKEKLRKENVVMEMPPENEISKRIDNVLRIIYLLFNEGYYSRTNNQILQKDFCLEALRLGLHLTEYENTNLPKTNALIALMCFHASRFDSRQKNGEFMIVYDEQDEELWDKDLINQGIRFLNLSARGNELSAYHLEARIAYWHCIREDAKSELPASSEKWKEILQLYDQLLEFNYSPSVLLNRIYAVYKIKGYKTALAEAEKLNYENNHFYYMLMGKLYQNIDPGKAKLNYQKAFSLAKTQTEKDIIQKRINDL